MPELTEMMLHCVYTADVNRIRKLLAFGESIEAVDADGRSALMHAVLATPAVATVVAALVQCGTNVNAKDRRQGWTSLAFAARACSAEICRILLDAGAEVDAIDVFGNTPLWRAVMARKTENAGLLISRGANPDRANLNGVSPRTVSERLGWTLPQSGG